MKKMEYQTASRIRKTSWTDLFADQLSDPNQSIAGAIGKTFSLKTQAFEKGIKQKFDPLNIAKFLTGGSALGPALLGKLTGRSARDISFFTGRYRPIRVNDTVSKLKPITPMLSPQKVDGDQSGVLNKIYQLMKDTQSRDLKRRNKEINFLEEKELENQKRHQEFMQELQKFLNVPSIFVIGKKEEDKGLFDSLWERIQGLLAGMGLSRTIPTPGAPGKGGGGPGGKPGGPVGVPTPGAPTPTPTEKPKGAEKLGKLSKALPFLGRTLGPAGIALAVAEGVALTAEMKKEIEADPFNPAYDNIPYAKSLRENKTVGQAAQESRKKSIKQVPRNQVQEIVNTMTPTEVYNILGKPVEEVKKWLDENKNPASMYQAPVITEPLPPTPEEIEHKRLAEEDRKRLIEQGSKPAFVAPKTGIRRKNNATSSSTAVPNTDKSKAMVKASSENSDLNLPRPVEDLQTQINNVSTSSQKNTGALLKLTSIAVRNTEDTFRRLIISNTRVV